MNRFFKTVLLTGLFVGTTDLVAAYVTQWIKTGNFSEKMLHFIAGGALGLDTAMEGGNGIAFLGLLIHYIIAFSFTLFFFVIFPKFKILSFNKYLVGMLYGVFVSSVMSHIILPLSALPHSPFQLSNAIVGWFTLGVVLGIPIAYNAYQYYGVNTRTSGNNE